MPSTASSAPDGRNSSCRSSCTSTSYRSSRSAPSQLQQQQQRPYHSMAKPRHHLSQYADPLVNDFGLLTSDMDVWARPQPPFTPHQRHPLAGPPAPLTRHASMPARQLTAALFQPQQPQQQQNYPSQQSQPPPMLARHHSHSFVSSLQAHPQSFPPLVNGSLPPPSPPRAVQAHEMQYLLEISMDQQQPLQYLVPSPSPRQVPQQTTQFMHRSIKAEPLPASPSLSVEPIAFSSADRGLKMAIDDFDPLAYAVFSSASASALKSAVPSDGPHAIESAFDSLDRLLPDTEPELLFRVLPTSARTSKGSNSNSSSSSSSSAATCKVTDCDRRVRSKGFCKTHGGGRKCSIDGCRKSSQNGDFCIGHGGGKKCKEEGCAKAAQSHGLCKAHGGGARCKYPSCNKSSQGGGLCRAHGGGKRCQAAGCPKGAQRGNFCATHGGFRNCKIEGCVRTDRGGGFCEVHRRGRLCKVEGCKKLSRNQGMCTMHIREDKQVFIEPLYA
ncbi:unnamed protein product [Hyaloperonospora brassicae]|uniref:WRKY19-like zinc finger domain-containing protein n=1 Tax=Hyaloperonospora brassicae TaxID=162125 RepID=A0AAV0ULE4_HYABA|nr:unnamed protein product [Hyaloperonospora brassicae]